MQPAELQRNSVPRRRTERTGESPGTHPEPTESPDHRITESPSGRQTHRPAPQPQPQPEPEPPRMMLQHSGPSLADISCAALVPCLSPPGTLTLDDFTSFTPMVKEELRLAIHTKRLSNGLSADLSSDGGASSSSDRGADEPGRRGPGKRELTSEELNRRKRRRERNKIAAAKCRNKKKEKTECLQKESEKLESVNAELKAQIETLKQQKQQLVYMLNLHRPTCIVRAQNGQTPEDERNLFIQHIKENTLQLHNLTAAAAAAGSASSLAPLDAELLSLDHVRCSGHL